MFLLVFWCFALLTSQHNVAGVLDTGYEYVQEADAWLRLHIVPAVWSDARVRCQLEGGIVASPSMTAIFQAMLAKMSVQKVTSRGVFTGIHALNTERDFTSLDGVPLADMIAVNWAPNEPNDENEDEKCVKMNGDGEVADVSCGSKYPYFCRKETANMNVTNDCPTTAKGYKYEPLTGSCYKFHRIAQRWNRAARVCHAESGHLAIINDVQEAKVLKHIFQKNPIETIVDQEHSDVALIGIWKWDDKDGDWLTIHGETLEKAGYSQWAESLYNYGYGAINRNGLLDVVNKFDKDPFICEVSL